jgi:hypothetical protein
MSGLRVITPSRLLACFDIFPNINRIKKVKCPVYIIHGKVRRTATIALTTFSSIIWRKEGKSFLEISSTAVGKIESRVLTREERMPERRLPKNSTIFS